jgi:hypothetical protein
VIAQEICPPFPDDCLDDINKAVEVLKSPIIKKIPVVRASNLPGNFFLADGPFVKSTNGETSTFLAERFSAFDLKCESLRAGNSEETVFSCITEITGLMWANLCEQCNMVNQFVSLYNKADPSGTTEGKKRPDETDYVDDFLVSKSEHKVLDIVAAIEELTAKLADFNMVEYGVRIKFLPVIAAGGIVVEIGCVDVRTKTYHSVQRFNLQIPKQRMAAFVGVINMFRFIRTMVPHIPNYATPLFKKVNGITYRENFVIKDVKGSHTCPEELYTMLSNGEVPNAVTVTKNRSQTKLFVSPKGLKINDLGLGLSENEVRSAIIAVLQCLVYIHSKGFVHRDIRWSNIIKLISYTPQNKENVKFLVIDFEFGGKHGDPMEIQGYIHNGIVNHGASYYARHDMKLVAKLVNTWSASNNITLSANAQDFVDSISRDVGYWTAEQALQHDWIN